MRKLFYLSVLSLLFGNLTALSQKNSDVYITGYSQNNYYKFFDSLHNINKATIQSLKHSYKCYLIFKIDTNANFTEFEIIESPDAPLPEVAKKYIQYLFNSTNGKWSSNNTHKIPSDDLLFSVSFLKSNQSAKERIKDFEAVHEFALIGLPLQKRLKGYNLQNEVSITLSF